MKGRKTPRAARVRRHARVRHDLAGTQERPRLAVFRSLSHIYAQVIDDSASHTLAASSDLDADVRKGLNGKNKTEVAALVGESIARKAGEKGVKSVVFDRGGFKYHGRVKALADGARKAGLTF
jgi:large subunit ribosomal protein L18